MLRQAVLVILFLLLPFCEAVAQPLLPPGKPAGVRHAQETPNGAIAVGALVLITVVGFVVSDGLYKIPGTTVATSTQP